MAVLVAVFEARAPHQKCARRAAYGRRRAGRLVANLVLDQADEFCAAFPAADYYVSSAITGVLKVMGDRIDRGYILEWATRLGLQAIWEAILKRVGS